MIQLKAVELWRAGSDADWRPAAFETGEFKDTFHEEAMVRSENPLDGVFAAERPSAETGRAIETRDRAGVEAAYGSLTKACNGRHRAANVGGLAIKTPNARPGGARMP